MSDSPPLDDGRAKNVRLAHAALLGAALIYSGWNVLAERLLRSGASPVVFSFVRDAAAACVLLACSACLERSPRAALRAMRWREHGARFGVLGVAMASFQLCFIFGVALSDANTAAFFQCLDPSTALVVGMALRLERPTRAKVASAVVAGLGIVVMSCAQAFGARDARAPTPRRLAGMACLVGEGVFVSLYCLVQKGVLSLCGPVTLTALAYCVSAAVLALAAAVDTAARLERGAWALDAWAALGLGFSVLFASCLGYVSRAWANRHVDASVLVLYNAAQPPLTVALSLAFLGSGVSWEDAAGGALIVAGLLLRCVRARAAAAAASRLTYSSGTRAQCAHDDAREERRDDGARWRGLRPTSTTRGHLAFSRPEPKDGALGGQ